MIMGLVALLIDGISLIGQKREVVASGATEFQAINHDKNASAKYLLIPFISRRSIRPRCLQPTIDSCGGPLVHAHSYQTAAAASVAAAETGPSVPPSVCPLGLGRASDWPRQPAVADGCRPRKEQKLEKGKPAPPLQMTNEGIERSRGS